MRTLLITLFMGWLLIGCSEPTTGPVEVHWDRDICERCRMILSDRKHAAQIRYSDAQNRSRVRMFDDIGCAVIWLEDKPWRDADTTEIWASDHRNGEWIDARSAFYIKRQMTPMEYGLGAQNQAPIETSLSYAEAKLHIFEVEATYNQHGTHIKDGLERVEGQ
ncbi:MAG: nitrous oxide reductase accessory protein NosL [Gammaproteobacteria bacterium]|nr:nitrous oxide reductase accessory protein NosL [Gammaproteobacteria bacterium]